MTEEPTAEDLAKFIAIPVEAYYRLGWAVLASVIGINALCFGAGLWAGMHMVK